MTFYKFGDDYSAIVHGLSVRVTKQTFEHAPWDAVASFASYELWVVDVDWCKACFQSSSREQALSEWGVMCALGEYRLRNERSTNLLD